MIPAAALSEVAKDLSPSYRSFLLVSLSGQMLFLGPMPFLLLVWIHADDVLWYHSGFMVPAILCAILVMPLWSTQRYGMACHRIRVLQWCAPLRTVLAGGRAGWRHKYIRENWTPSDDVV